MILDKDLFVSVLQKTSNGIRLLDADGQYVRTLTQAETAAYMGTGNYQAVGRANRVRYLRAISKDWVPPVERKFEIDAEFWRDRHLWTWTAADMGKQHPIMALDGAPA